MPSQPQEQTFQNCLTCVDEGSDGEIIGKSERIKLKNVSHDSGSVAHRLPKHLEYRKSCFIPSSTTQTMGSFQHRWAESQDESASVGTSAVTIVSHWGMNLTNLYHFFISVCQNVSKTWNRLILGGWCQFSRGQTYSHGRGKSARELSQSI